MVVSPLGQERQEEEEEGGSHNPTLLRTAVAVVVVAVMRWVRVAIGRHGWLRMQQQARACFRCRPGRPWHREPPDAVHAWPPSLWTSQSWTRLWGCGPTTRSTPPPSSSSSSAPRNRCPPHHLSREPCSSDPAAATHPTRPQSLLPHQRLLPLLLQQQALQASLRLPHPPSPIPWHPWRVGGRPQHTPLLLLLLQPPHHPLATPSTCLPAPPWISSSFLHPPALLAVPTRLLVVTPHCLAGLHPLLPRRLRAQQPPLLRPSPPPSSASRRSRRSSSPIARLRTTTDITAGGTTAMMATHAMRIAASTAACLGWQAACRPQRLQV